MDHSDIYFMVPLYKRFIRSFNTALIFCVINILIYLGMFYIYVPYVISKGWDLGIVTQNPLCWQFIFSLGILVIFARKEDKTGRLCCCLIAMSILTFFEPYTSSRHQMQTLLLIAAVFTVLYPLKKNVKGTVFYKLNKYGLSIYLLHPFILVICCSVIEQFESKFIRGAVAIFLSLYAAYIVQNAVEIISTKLKSTLSINQE